MPQRLAAVHFIISIPLPLSGMLRSRYYFAYYLSESINNLAGLGFDGVDKEGNENWDLINNVEISKVIDIAC